MKNNNKIALLIIDAQNDFCQPTGSLYVTGAEKDMERLAKFIRNNKESIDFIGMTQDNHHVNDISHPSFWQDKDGNYPAPFTLITSTDVDSGKWSPRFYPKMAIEYIHELEKQGEFPHVIWPEHCLIGTTGAAIVDDVMNAVKDWCRLGYFYQMVTKGTFPLTEHFGAFRANIPMEGHPETQLNHDLIKTLEKYDLIYFAGEAKSHCVASTLRQSFDFPTLAKKFVILEDCMSNVTGFETLADPIYEEARKLGIKFGKSTDSI
jgi:nicotinamidase-related amidase